MNVIDQEHGKDWTLYNGDSSEVLMALPEASVDLTVTSIPFGSLYTYSPSVRDLGNNASHEDFWTQFSWVSKGLMRVHRPGSMVCIHVSQLAEFVKTHGQTGRYDFRGDTIRHFRDAGFTYYSEITINKNPQAQAIRTHAKGLLFVQLDRDSREMWQAMADYVLVFRTHGTHPVKLETDITREEWIKLASPVWWDIRETDILPVIAAREEADERHICPLQLPLIRNCIRLWSGPGEVVLDPFNGVGSTGHEALKLGRKYVGVELKPSYYKVAAGNLRAAEASSTTMDMFAAAGIAL